MSSLVVIASGGAHKRAVCDAGAPCVSRWTMALCTVFPCCTGTLEQGWLQVWPPVLRSGRGPPVQAVPVLPGSTPPGLSVGCLWSPSLCHSPWAAALCRQQRAQGQGACKAGSVPQRGSSRRPQHGGRPRHRSGQYSIIGSTSFVVQQELSQSWDCKCSRMHSSLSCAKLLKCCLRMHGKGCRQWPPPQSAGWQLC